MSEAQDVSRTECRCDLRKAAQAAHDFIYLPHSKVWVFPEVRRSMSERTRYYAFAERKEYPHEDHTGEHYSFVNCPWCGHCLPWTAEPARNPSDTTGDPEL